jgi:hypothetical protein
MVKQLPPPRFQRLERVSIRGERPQSKQYEGERGVVVWLDSFYARMQPEHPDRWMYVVHLPDRGCWPTFLQADLESSGEFDPETAHLGKQPEISFDTLLEEENVYVEGSYRLPGRFWQVVVFRKGNVPEVQHEPSRWEKPTPWEQEITGIVITVPQEAKVDRGYLLRVISQATGYDGWVEVSGPDSMILR